MSWQEVSHARKTAQFSSTLTTRPLQYVCLYGPNDQDVSYIRLVFLAHHIYNLYIWSMDFAWDADKDRENRVKHGISFEEATSIFDGPILTKIDDRNDYGEVREICMGMLSPDVVLVVVYTERGEKTRLISARKANRRERQVFYDYLATTFEGH